jgi:hypothetical protein
LRACTSHQIGIVRQILEEFNTSLFQSLAVGGRDWAKQLYNGIGTGGNCCQGGYRSKRPAFSEVKSTPVKVKLWTGGRLIGRWLREG